MACIVYEGLVKKWRVMVQSTQDDASTVSAYWEAENHRATCEVCKDEGLAQVLAFERGRKFNFILSFPKFDGFGFALRRYDFCVRQGEFYN
jgi:hypothetical protein